MTRLPLSVAIWSPDSSAPQAAEIAIHDSSTIVETQRMRFLLIGLSIHPQFSHERIE